MSSKIVRKTTAAAAKSAKPVTTVRKAAASAKARAPAPPSVPAAEPSTPKPKQKLVRDSFTIPKVEYAVLDALKARAANLQRPVKKSELLRAGIRALSGMSDKAFLAAVNAVPSLKTGRPSGAEAAAPAGRSAK